MKSLLTLICVAACLALSELSAQTSLKGFAIPDMGQSGSPALNRRLKGDFKVDPANNIWMVFTGRKLGSALIVSSYGVARFDGSMWTNYSTGNSQLPTNYATSIDFDGSIVWIGTKAGLAKLDGTAWTIYNKANSQIVYDSINDVCVINGKLWIATDNGVSVLSGGVFSNYTTTSGLAGNKVYCVEAGNNNEIYFGTDKGLSMLNTLSGQWKTYNKANSGLKKEEIYALKKEANGAIWIGTDSANINGDEYSSVYVLNNGVIQSLVEKNICTVRYNLYPVSTYSFGGQGGNIIFNAGSVTGMSDPMLRLMEYKNGTLNMYNIRELSHPVGGLLLDYDKNNHIWFAGRDGMLFDSLYRFTPSQYRDPLAVTKSYLDINKVSTPVTTNGDLFWDRQNPQYEVPKGSCKKALFAGGLWIGGVVNHNLRIAAQTYRQSGNDYWPGPLSNGTAAIDPATKAQYDKIWRINRFTIEDFKRNFANGNVQNGTYAIPEQIATWPAMGDPSKGQAAFLAPFADVDNNRLYEPSKGDYPEIKGDQMLFWIMNDNAGMHSETGGVPLGVEIHGSAYAYTCDQISDDDPNTALNYTTLYHYDIFNRSNETIDTFKLGIWTDVDLGNYADDYIGCNPKEGYGYVYNGDDNDEGWTGYGQNPPAVATLMLKGLTDYSGVETGLSGFMYYNNDYSLTGNPVRAEHYWEYLNSKWKDGTSLTYGGSGKGGSDPASHMFPGTNDLAGRPEWSEITAGNPPADKRHLLVTGPGKLEPGGANSVDFAIVYSRTQIAGGSSATLNKLEEDVKKVKSWFNDHSFPSCFDVLHNGIAEERGNPSVKLVIRPNPANHTINIPAGDLVNAHYAIFDITGKLFLSGKLADTNDIDIRTLKEGMYFVRIAGKDHSCSLKFIKQ